MSSSPSFTCSVLPHKPKVHSDNQTQILIKIQTRNITIRRYEYYILKFTLKYLRNPTFEAENPLNESRKHFRHRPLRYVFSLFYTAELIKLEKASNRTLLKNYTGWKQYPKQKKKNIIKLSPLLLHPTSPRYLHHSCINILNDFNR